jgi:hypothetical protein
VEYNGSSGATLQPLIWIKVGLVWPSAYEACRSCERRTPTMAGARKELSSFERLTQAWQVLQIGQGRYLFTAIAVCLVVRI